MDAKVDDGLRRLGGVAVCRQMRARVLLKMKVKTSVKLSSGLASQATNCIPRLLSHNPSLPLGRRGFLR